jgi:alkanesulfonate monooxygenase SsuD/methylene tetrahydromethanopterin reductase-like flavin-dependent oxidoreductase (luciferase family)
MTEVPFTGHVGTFATVPPRNVVPKPVQKPHPPLWVACSRRDTILLAAEKGIGALTFAFIDPEEAEQWVGDYEKTMRERCVPVGLRVDPNVACVTPMMCHPDEDRAIEMGLEGGNFFGYSLAHYYVFGEHAPATTNVWEEFQERREKQGYSPAAALAERRQTLGAKAASGASSGLRGAVGTPEQIREFLRRYEEAGVDQVIFVMQAGKNTHEDICESLERFATEVMPEFAERDEQQRKEKLARFEPIIEAAFERKVDDRPAMPEGYIMKAIPKAMVDQSGNDQFQEWLDSMADQQATGTPDEVYERTILG